MGNPTDKIPIVPKNTINTATVIHYEESRSDLDIVKDKEIANEPIPSQLEI